MDIKEEMEKKRKAGWVEASFSIEALAVEEDIVKTALEDHVDKLGRIRDVFVCERKFHPPQLLKNPPQGIEKAYSQAVDISFFAKDVYTLLNLVMVYGPSAVEILGPRSREVKIDELQSIVNTLAGLVHEFAAQGVGGIVISSQPKKDSSDSCGRL